MRIRKAGKVCDHLWYLGVQESGLYLLEGRDYSLFISGGMGYIAPDLLAQIKRFAIDEGKIKGLIILHAHFDHIGLVPFLQKRYPDLKIFASKRAWEILSMPKALETINSFSKMVAERMRPDNNLANLDLLWRADITGDQVCDGELIDLGGIEALVLETPGHSSCSISVYVPKIKALIPSDAGGIPYKDLSVPTGNSNFTLFQRSLDKMSGLDVDYFCADHYGYITGEEARGFIGATIEAASRLRDIIEQLYRRRKDLESTVQLLISEHYRRNPDYFLSPEILTGVYRQMVRHISQSLEQAKENPSS